MNSFFDLMRDTNLTTVRIGYNYRSDEFAMFAAKEWPSTLDFSMYNHGFTAHSIFGGISQYYNTRQFIDLCRTWRLYDCLEEIQDKMRAGRHEEITLYYLKKFNIRFACFTHNRGRGLQNRSHGTTCGGIRRHHIQTPEQEVFVDGLNLGRAMSFKNLAARIPFGGSKITVQMDTFDIENKEMMGFLAFAVDRCSVVTAPDMNLPTAISDKMAEQGYTSQFVGGSHSKIGPTGKPTAYGVYLSLKEAVRFKEGSASLCGKSVLVVGLGAVGWPMAEYVLSEGASLSVSDINEARVNEFLQSHPGQGITPVDPDDVLDADIDILSPCAAGGLITKEAIERLKCKYIWGSANNQLATASKEEELNFASRIAERGICYQSEWWHNTAGVICMAEEYLHESDLNLVMRKIEDVIPNATFDNLTEAAQKGITPTENCYAKCENVIYT